MLSVLSFHGVNYGLPLCVSGISHPLALSLEMADHDLRRESIRRHRSQGRERFERIYVLRELKVIKEEEISGDLDDLCTSLMGCTAKAA
ncbi:hypothetical protein IFM89_024076 [Coptis chinensis]|uniref:Uncharacterized protein n=1 Tax=Coptis chinensis TaxID=261450 RepID=A0A835HUJ4_9MAGN|nr:hypothetical protein IFM89_024076 [Coptis chinensis]